MRANIQLFNQDCMEAMREMPDNAFDLAIVDPPFPINVNGGGRFRKLMREKQWISTVPEKKYFQEIARVSIDFIIWGANYFTNYLSPNNKWIIWHKNHAGDKVGFSECEMAYSTKGKNIRYYKKSILGLSLNWHACAKPIDLYKWTLKNYAKEGDKILDTHLGSGSIAIACWDMGFDLTGYEIDKDYYKAAVDRLERHKAQYQLF